MITSIKFPSRWQAKHDTENTGIAEFKLGLGPCGKTVEDIRAKLSPDNLEVILDYQGGGSTSYSYLTRDILGRIEVEYS